MKKKKRSLFLGYGIFLVFLALWTIWPFYKESRKRRDIKRLEETRQNYLQSNDYRRALKVFQTITPRLPQRLDLKIEQAYIAAQAGENEAALSALKRAEALKPDAVQHHEIAMLYQRLGQNERTLDILNELLRKQPENAVWFKDRGICRFLMGDTRKAQKDLETAIRIKPGLLSAYVSLGAVHTKEGRNTQALKLYRRALLQKPEPDEKIYLDQIRRLLSGE